MQPIHPMKCSDVSSRYAIGRLLGAGGFGCVFEAWDRRAGCKVAVKRMQRDVPQARDALLQEARCAALLRHEAFVRVLALAGSGSNRALVMELVQGQTVQALLRRHRGGIGPGAALDIALQVADAMTQSHDAGLVHGDLTPANLLQERTGKVRIVDFGVARLYATPASGPSEVCGTVAYMAPERLLGHPLRPACDIYALGVMLYEMLAGRHPFAGLRNLALAAALLQNAPDSWPWPGASAAAVVALVRSMTASDPSRRPASMRAVAAAIRALQRFTPPSRQAPARRRTASPRSTPS